MNAIWVAAIHTPWWVYALFIFLIIKGIQASKPQVVSIKKLVLLPLIFVAFSIHILITSFKINTMVICVWLVSIIVGSLIGWLLISHHNLKVDKIKKLIQLPGNWMTFILIVVVFAAKYYFSYQLESDPALVNNTGFEYSMLCVTGVCTGLFVGRLMGYFYKMWTGKSVDLVGS